VDTSILDEISDKSIVPWPEFSREEFKFTLSSCNNSSAPGPDKLSWNHLKTIFDDIECLDTFIQMANACINLGYWLSHFKTSTTIVISKPNKKLYDSPKSFRPIVLLNTMGKLIEKVIGERLQFHTVSNNFIHPSQLGSLKFKSTTDAGIALTHAIQTGWVKNLTTSTLTFNITQFFPLLNHQLLSLIIKKAGFDQHISSFFADYLVNRKMNYSWSNFSSPTFNINVRVGQGSALSPILSTLYLSPFIYILENQLKNLKIPTSFISFVDDGLFISQSNLIDISNSCLYCSYNVLTNLLEKFGLVVEHSKTEVFHFNRSHGVFNPPPLDLSPLGGNILILSNTWKYLGFIFDRKLIFHQHVDFYTNKAIFTVKYMKLLSNSSCSINPLQKQLLYRMCVLPIALYGFQLWFYNHVPMAYHMKILNKMQRRAAIWILGAFKTSPSYGVEAIAGLIPIKLHLQKLGGRSQLQESSLLPSVTLVALDASIKNNVATSIVHIHMADKPLTKTIHHAVNVTSTEAELFAIRCGINQSSCFNNISKIIIITDSIHTARKIFDPSSHPFQTMSATILSDLHDFFNRSDHNSIEFWECPSRLKWVLYGRVDKETKSFNLMPLFPYKNSWDFSKKNESDDIIKYWKMLFQASELKGNHFLDLLDSDNKIIKLTYTKGGLWLKLIGHSNSLCAHTTRAITNHAPISKYRLRFFLREEFRCPYSHYLIESR